MTKEQDSRQTTLADAAAAAGAETKPNGGNGNAEAGAAEGGAPSPPAPSQVPAVRTGTPMNIGDRGIVLADLAALWRFSAIVLESGLAPASFKSQASVAIAIQMGMELGMTPVMALQNIAVINGRPAPFGAIVKGLIENSGLLADYDEYFEGTFPNDDFKAVVISLRKGREKPLRSEFSIGDAKLAKLWGKTGAQGQPTPWVTFPRRMVMWRARQFNYNDNFADVTKGFRIKEVVQDDDFIDSEVVGSSPIAMPARASETAPATEASTS